MDTNYSWFWKYWIPVLALIISILSAWFAYEQTAITKRISHLHIEPEIEPLFDLPPKGNPIFILTNNGDIPVVSLSVFHDVYVYNSDVKKIVSYIKAGRWLGQRMIFEEELRPTKFIKSELVGLSGPEYQIAIYKFQVKYYRSEDMQPYEKEILYFVRGKQVIDHAKFRTDPLYKIIIEKMNDFNFMQNQIEAGKLKDIIEAWEMKNPSGQ